MNRETDQSTASSTAGGGFPSSSTPESRSPQIVAPADQYPDKTCNPEGYTFATDAPLSDSNMVSARKKAEREHVKPLRPSALRDSASKYQSNENMHLLQGTSSHNHQRQFSSKDITSIDWLKEEHRATKRNQNLDSSYNESQLRGYDNSPGLIKQWIDDYSGLFLNIKRIFYQLQGWSMSIIIGLAAGVLAAVVTLLTDWLHSFRSGYCRSRPWLSRSHCCSHTEGCKDWIKWIDLLHPFLAGQDLIVGFLVSVVISLTLLFGASVLSKRVSNYVVGSGIPEIKTILNGGIIVKCLGLQTMVAKIIAIIMVSSSGVLIGFEEAIVHIICAYTNVVSRIFPTYHHNEAQKRQIFGVAVSASISAVFRSPIGGILFAFEEVCTYFSYETLVYSLLANVIAMSLYSYIFPIKTSTDVFPGWVSKVTASWSYFELLPLLLLTVITALFGSAIRLLFVYLYKSRKKSVRQSFPIIDVLVISLLSLACIYWIPLLNIPLNRGISILFTHTCDSRSVSKSILNPCLIFDAPVPFILFVLAPIALLLFAPLANSTMIPSGVMIPSILSGGAIGFIAGMLMKLLQETYPGSLIFFECNDTKGCIHPNTYAIVGGLSSLISTTGVTVSAVAIFVESFNLYGFILPLSLSALLSRFISRYFHKSSLFDYLIEVDSYPYIDRNVPRLSHRWIAADVMTPRASVISLRANSYTVRDIRSMLEGTDIRGYPVLLPDGLLIGYISAVNLDQAISHHPQDTVVTFAYEQFRRAGALLDQRSKDKQYLNISPFLESTPITISAYCPMDTVCSMFKALGIKYLCVCKRGILVGIITKRDIISFIKNNGKRKHDMSALSTISSLEDDFSDIIEEP